MNSGEQELPGQRSAEQPASPTPEPGDVSIHAAVDRAHQDIEGILAARIASGPAPEPEPPPMFLPRRPWWQFWRR